MTRAERRLLATMLCAILLLACRLVRADASPESVCGEHIDGALRLMIYAWMTVVVMYLTDCPWRQSIVRCVMFVLMMLCASVGDTCQNKARADEPTTLVLAQALVAEANWTATNDHAAIAHVLQRRAMQRGVSLETMCGLYVSVLRKREGVYVVNTPRAQWIRGLTLDARKPEAWPADQSWEANAPRWRAVIATATAFLAGRLINPCPGAEHWGSHQDRVWRGLSKVECSGHTLNVFYAVSK